MTHTHLQKNTNVFQAIVQGRFLSWGWLLVLMCSLAGCPASSEWDQQWQHIQFTLEEGRLQDAKELLQDILPSLRDNGPTDPHYGQVIFQLADIARLEGKTSQAESFYWEALPLIAQSLGPEHERMADPLTELAKLYESTFLSPIGLFYAGCWTWWVMRR